MSWSQIFAWSSWNFGLVHLFFMNWIAHCFPRHAWCSLSVLICAGNIFLRAVGILRLCNSPSAIGLHIVLLGMHAVLPLFCFVMAKSCFQEGVRILSLCNYSWSIGAQFFFARHAWCTLSCSSYDGKLLLETICILSLCIYSSSIVLHDVFLCMHGVLCLFS